MVTSKIYFMHQLNFHRNCHQSICPIPIQNHMHWWWIEIKESPKYKLYDNIGDLVRKLFISKQWQQEELLGYAAFTLITHTVIPTLSFTSQLCYKPLSILQRVTQSQKVHISCHDWLQNFITSALIKICPRVSQSMKGVTGILPCLIK